MKVSSNQQLSSNFSLIDDFAYIAFSMQREKRWWSMEMFLRLQRLMEKQSWEPHSVENAM